SGTHFHDTGFEPSISADGRFVAFAGGPASADLAGPQIFVRDRQRRTTRQVSLTPGGQQPDEHSANPSISSSGRYVAFQSDASDLVPGDSNGVTDVFVRDRTTSTTTLV